MNRTEYRQARRLIRDNGRYALRWLPAQHRETAELCFLGYSPCDILAERARHVSRFGPLSAADIKAEIRLFPLT